MTWLPACTRSPFYSTLHHFALFCTRSPLCSTLHHFALLCTRSPLYSAPFCSALHQMSASPNHRLPFAQSCFSKDHCCTRSPLCSEPLLFEPEHHIFVLPCSTPDYGCLPAPDHHSALLCTGNWLLPSPCCSTTTSLHLPVTEFVSAFNQSA